MNHVANDIYYQAADYILSSLGITPTPQNVNMLVAWMPNEYTPDELAVTNNPLATSLKTAGADGYCYIPGVGQSSEPCYDTLADGSAACAQTIANGLYPHILAGLQNSDPNTFFSSAAEAEFSQWSGGSPGYMQRIQQNYESLPPPPSWALSVSSPPPPAFAPPPVSQGFLWLGGILFAGGLALLGWEWWQNRRTPSYGFARLIEEHDTDTRINPDYLTYIAPTQEDVSEVTEPLNACTVYDRVKKALQERGVAVVENRSMPPNTEAFYTDEDGDRILLSPSVSLLAKECNPYATQTLLHEGTHALLHNPDCMPSFRGQMYTSVAHQVEEQEAELASLATMVRLGLPVETYDGTVIPPGRAEVAWERAKRDLDPVTYENVRWASDWLTRAARGEDGSLVSEKCPPARLIERR